MIYNSYYYLTPYVPSIDKFHIGKGRDEIFNERYVTTIRIYYREKLLNNNKQIAEALQNQLNQALISQQQSYNELVARFIAQLNNINLNTLISKEFLNVKGTNISLNSTRIKSREYEKEFRQIVQNIFPDKKQIKTEDINTVIRRLNGYLRPIRKSIFDSLLTEVLDIATKEASRISEELIDDLVIQLNNFNSNKITLSSNHSSTVSISLRDNNIKIVAPHGTGDVEVTGLSGDIEPFGAKVKNYATGNNKISLINNANVSGLIALWPTTNAIKNLALNGLSGRDPFPYQFSIIKDIFLLQALAGTGNSDLLNSFIIIGTGNEERPILVFSTYELYFGEDQIEGEFTKITPIGNVPRTQKDFSNFVANTQISIKTKMKLNKMIT